jgi:hypothetical protein
MDHGLRTGLTDLGATSWLRLRGVLRVGPSPIQGLGVFALREFAQGESIGRILLGPAGPQSRHSICVAGLHRHVYAPYRYLNHACSPSTGLVIEGQRAALHAARAVHSGDELTLDYGELDETPSVRFSCRCPSCEQNAAQIG